jgi:hypothetical protein
MKVPAVFYSAKFDALVIVRGKSLNESTGEWCIPVEWDWKDMTLASEQIRGNVQDHAIDLFALGKFVHVGEL